MHRDVTMHTTYTTKALSQLFKDIRTLKYRKKSETGWGRGTEKNERRSSRDFLLDEATDHFGCLCDARMVDINIHRTAKSRFNIHNPRPGYGRQRRFCGRHD